MADMDNFKEAESFGINTPQETTGFPLKGCNNLDWGMKNRLARIFGDDGKSLMLACDHGFIMGPTGGVERIDLSIVPLLKYADCLMCTRGILRSVIPPTANIPVCLRSDAGTSILTNLNDNVVIAAEEAVRVNASAMAVMIAVGDELMEAKTMANLYHTVDIGQKYGIPVMGVTAVGKQMARDAKYFRLATRMAAENGANIVKSYYVEEGFETVVASCPVPIVIAGGKKIPERDALDLAYRAMQAGAAGVDMGRNVFQSTNPAAMIQAVAGVIHGGLTPDAAYEMFQDLSK
ncbi:MAG: 3-hydroxy-5-phosphonooxypentane-2,4-dione thiolase [bacterium]|nr:3-hydroxy-5-phosphonooxypentane-2,4-dione thiolase [bacterium]MDO5462825.1 3-hydroxy-5-phosphonooxypentane-2,4-dione thiolase [bacterium]